MVSTASYHETLKPWKPPARKTFLFTNVNLVDVENGVVHENATIKLSSGRIENIKLHSHANGNADPQSLSDVDIHLDFEGKYLCPGLFDCHVHIIAVPGEKEWQDTKSLNPTSSAYRHAYVCQQMLDRGFTTVRDCGGASLALKQSIEDGLIQGPRLFIAGSFLSQTGGHGDTRGCHDHSNIECCGGGSSNFPSFICDGVPECLRAARENIRTGSDFIKIMGGGGVCSPTDRIDNVQFTSEEICAITTVAKNSQTYVTSHAYTPRSIKQALENGVLGIEHGNLIDRETAELMVQKGAYLTPTLVTYTAMGDESFAGYMPAESMEKNAEVYVAGLQGLKIAADAGVNICYGSDLLGHLGVAQLNEFTIRSQVLPALAILQSATITPAKMMGQDKFLGQVKRGFAADLLVLNANPLEDITVLARPEEHLLTVIKDGRICMSRWRSLDQDVQRQRQYIE
ncbi:amidohydrolase [Rhexocercosporidium sp. MPI-PUGE-AT-0058]|nr:amidohydrolase [Rhexocercosporidium sp. MPI-PUGE-AT-0058]